MIGLCINAEHMVEELQLKANDCEAIYLFFLKGKGITTIMSLAFWGS
jgi:hypothetical protein